MDPVAGDLHLAAYMAQSRAGIFGHLFFGNDAAGDLVVYVGQRLQGTEHLVQGVVGKLRFLAAAIVFGSGGTGQKRADGQELMDT